MARKTLNEKRIALHRKKTKLLEQLLTSENTKIKPAKVTTINTVSRYSYAEVLPEESKRIKYFFQDLRKSFILILLITTLEIVFYFASMNKYFVNLLKF